MENNLNTNFGNSQNRFNILYCANQYEQQLISTFPKSSNTLKKANTFVDLFLMAQNLSIYEMDTFILIELAVADAPEVCNLIDRLKRNWLSRNLTVIFLLTEPSVQVKETAFMMRINDCYQPGFSMEDVKLRMQYLSTYKILHMQLENLPKDPIVLYKIPLIKRFFDISMSVLALMLLSPILIIVAILIKLDSKGPILYKSKRVGTGYQIFSFYKFRSMRINADQEVAALMQKNQYGDSAFFKLENDPRVTKLGEFLRSSSLDELPQLLNVIKGDMSIVGNRPLPLYEAEQLTTNEWSKRFLGPAGITGLWQIIKRGKADMSDRERKKLDNFYNEKVSFWFDIKIIFMTLPALFQKAKV